MAWEDQILINMVNENIKHIDFLKDPKKLINEKIFIFEQVVNFLNQYDPMNQIDFGKKPSQALDKETSDLFLQSTTTEKWIENLKKRKENLQKETDKNKQLPFSVVMPLLVYLERSVAFNNTTEPKNSLKNLFILSTFEAIKFNLDDDKIKPTELFRPGYYERADLKKEIDFLRLIHSDISVKNEDVLKIIAKYGNAEIVKQIMNEIENIQEIKENTQLKLYLDNLNKDFETYKKEILSENFHLTHPAYDEQTVPLEPLKVKEVPHKLSETVLHNEYKSEQEKINAISSEIKATILKNFHIGTLLDLFIEVQSHEFDFLRAKQTNTSFSQSGLSMFNPAPDLWDSILVEFKKKVIYLADRDDPKTLKKNLERYHEIINTDGSNPKENTKYKNFLTEILEEKKIPVFTKK